MTGAGGRGTSRHSTEKDKYEVSNKASQLWPTFFRTAIIYMGTMGAGDEFLTRSTKSDLYLSFGVRCFGGDAEHLLFPWSRSIGDRQVHTRGLGAVRRGAATDPSVAPFDSSILCVER